MASDNSPPALVDGALWNPALRPDSDAVDIVAKEDSRKTDGTEIASKSDNEASISPPIDPTGEQDTQSGKVEVSTEESQKDVETAKDELAPADPAAPSSPVESEDEWNAGDRIDPAWGLQSPAAINHTNSFPPVPPREAESMLPAQPLAHSQAEDIMGKDENEDNNMNASQLDPWGEDADAGTGDGAFFSNSNNLDTANAIAVEPSDMEARYEEGIPLVQNDSRSPKGGEAEASAGEHASDSVPFEPSFDEDNNGDDFFSQIGAREQETTNMPGIDRKSTEQVLSNMEFPHHSVNHDEPVSQPEAPAPNQENNDTLFASGTSASKEEDLDALWKAALDDDELLEDEPAIDPSAFFEDDGEGFLDDSSQPPQQQSQVPAAAAVPVNSSSVYHPSKSYAPVMQNTQIPSQPSRYAPAGAPSLPNGMNTAYGQPPQPFPRPPPTERAQSFADKAKGGYSSPFDAPMDLSRPKRRPAQFQAPPSSRDGSSAQAPPPPPRTSSVQSSSSIGNQQTPPLSANQASQEPPRPPPKTDSSSFFEELPVAQKARQSPTARFSQPAAQPTPPPSRGMSTGPPQPLTLQPGPAQQNDFGLVTPNRVMSFGIPQSSAPQAQQYPPESTAPPKTAPPPNTKYSPAPTTQVQDSGRNRYAASTGVIRPPSVSLPHQPRTSSPLARSASVTHQYQPQPNASYQAQPPQSNYAPAPPTTGAPPSGSGPPRMAQPKRMSYDPLPSLPQKDHVADIIDRPSVTQRGLMQESSTAHIPQQGSPPLLQRSLRPQGPPPDANFVPPSDGQEHDPLKRWQGAPIFNFGFGGSITVSFPQRIPRFSSGQAAPMIKCSPGTVKIESSKSLPFDEHLASFPGPLKTKAKKKEVLEWLQKNIQRLEQQYVQSIPQETPIDVRKRHEEKIILWKVLSVFVEYDGNLEGNLAATKTIREILSPELAFEGPANQLSYTSDMLPTGITSNQNQVSRDPTSIDSLETIRKLLLQGDREKAVWFAVDQKLWGHAMLIASTLQPEIRKQVAQEFVKTDVKPIGDNTESLAALYDVFAGNWEESVDRLVPPSARAGLQMVSKTAMSGPAKNAFEGLDRWKETLSLILSNRSLEDGRSMVALGQLLSTYGRIEAAHVCFIFSRAPSLLGGSEDPHAQMVLLGADHQHYPFDYGRDIEHVLLTEIYEFGLSVLSTTSPAVSHLLPFKLYHATVLADYGLKNEAQLYCDLIASAPKATTKMSPYYHARLFAGLEDLNARLRQAPKDGSGSWISKPSMDKVSSSFFNKFTSFVAGDESDAASVASAQADSQGPFARMSGDTPPSLSRSGSPTESYGYASGYTPMVAAAQTNSRYAPNSSYAPRTSIDQSSLHRQPSHLSMQSGSPDLSRSMHSGYAPSSSYQATPPSQVGFSPAVSSQAQFQSQESPEPETAQTFVPPVQPREAARSSPYEPRRASYQSSPASTYDPPPTSTAARSSSYGPRSYQPSGAEKAAHAPTMSDSYEPQAPNPDIPISSSPPPMLEPPSISHEPPTPGPNDQNTPNFGYNPLPGSSEESNVKEDSSSYEPPTSSYEPPKPDESEETGYQPPTSSYEPPTSSYEPPTSSYEPPSYQPYDPDANGDDNKAPSSPVKKKKSFMDLSDDEDGLTTRAGSLKNDNKPREKTKAEKDREAEEAFRRAAEADAAKDQRPAAAGQRSSWLGGWFSKSSTPAPDLQPKAIKAKLGDDSSFYYDKDLKKWINKNAPDSATPSAPTPPPPKGPPVRNASTSSLPPMKAPTSAPSGPPMGPPSANSSRNVSPSLGSGPPMASGPPLAGVTPSGIAPPSRPGTGMSGVSNASSIDDLIGVPQARKGGTIKGKKKGRGYVDVMAKD